MNIISPKFTYEEKRLLVMAARSFMGAKWAHHGRLPNKMDCVGLVELSVKSVRPSIRPARTDYGRTPHNHKLRQELSEYFGPAVIGNVQLGDIVTLRWVGEENHVAIVTDHDEYPFGLIHCANIAPNKLIGGVIEHGADAQWRSRIVEIFRP